MNDIFLDKWGIPGAIIIALSSLIVWFIRQTRKDNEKNNSEMLKQMQDMLKTHREERKEWKESDDKKFEEITKISKEGASILSGLKTLIENRKV